MCDTIRKYWGAELKEQIEKTRAEAKEEAERVRREEERNMTLMNRLAQEGRTDDIIKATQNKEYKELLMAEIGI